MLAPDAVQRSVAERQVKLPDQAAGAEGGEVLAQGDDLLFDVSRGLARLVMGGPRLLDQARGAALEVAPQPLAYRGHGGGEGAGGWLDPLPSGKLNQSQAMVVGVSHLTHQVVVRGGGVHGPSILGLLGGCLALPPARQPTASVASYSCTTTSPG